MYLKYLTDCIIYVNRDEHKESVYIEKLPSGKHSCKGIGRTMPDPAASLIMNGEVEVPLGKPIPSNVNDTTLLYNEYPLLNIYLFFKIHDFLTLKVFIKTYYY